MNATEKLNDLHITYYFNIFSQTSQLYLQLKRHLQRKLNEFYHSKPNN